VPLAGRRGSNPLSDTIIYLRIRPIWAGRSQAHKLGLFTKRAGLFPKRFGAAKSPGGCPQPGLSCVLD
jgi:hypothetical protein